MYAGSVWRVNSESITTEVARTPEIRNEICSLRASALSAVLFSVRAASRHAFDSPDALGYHFLAEATGGRLARGFLGGNVAQRQSGRFISARP